MSQEIVKKTENVRSITALRIFATCLVVIGHACAVFSDNWGGVSQIESGILKILHDGIYFFHMPLFMSISGYCFQLHRPLVENMKTYNGFILKKFRRLLIPFLLIKYLYLMPIEYGLGICEFESIGFAGKVREYMTNFSADYLWFLWVLFLIFACQGIIQKYDANDLIFTIELVVSAVFVLLCTKWLNMPHAIRQCVIYSFWFILGRAICKHKADQNIWIAITCSMLIAVQMLRLKYSSLSIISDFALKIEITLLLYVIARLLTSNKMLNAGRNPDYTMGVYLFHVPLQYVVLNILTTTTPCVLFAVLLIIGGAIPIAITKLLRKYSLAFIVGE